LVEQVQVEFVKADAGGRFFVFFVANLNILILIARSGLILIDSFCVINHGESCAVAVDGLLFEDSKGRHFHVLSMLLNLRLLWLSSTRYDHRIS
jgi:hypothetical protein